MQSFSFHPEHGCLFPASDPCVVSVDFSLALLMLHSLASVTPQSIVGGSKWRKGTQNKQMKKTKMLTLFFWLRYYSLIWIGKMSQVMVQNQFRNSMLMAFPAPYLCSFDCRVLFSSSYVCWNMRINRRRSFAWCCVAVQSLCQIRTLFWYCPIAFISFAPVSVPGAVFCLTALLYLLLFLSILSFWGIIFSIKEDLQKNTFSSHFCHLQGCKCHYCPLSFLIL